MSKKEEITKSDLLEMENRINREQQTARHGQNNNIQKAFNLADEVKTDTRLLSQSITNMEKNISELKKEIKEGFQEIKDILKEEYVKKSEFEEIRNTLRHHSKIFWAVFSISLTTIIAAIYRLIIK